MRFYLIAATLLVVGVARGVEVVELDPTVDADDQAGEKAMDKELASAKILPETDKEKVKAFGRKFTLTSFASGDCSGKNVGQKSVDACAGSSEIKECPDDMWTEGFTCKETEKAGDTEFNQKWRWGVYNENFVMRLSDGTQDWKALAVGKKVGDTGVVTCYSSTDDVRTVFLEHKVNSPSCKPVTNYGVGESQATANGDNAGFIPVIGSFTLTPTEPNANTPKDKILSNDDVLVAPPFSGNLADIPKKMPAPN